jgi:hypothetical protein
VFAPALYKAAGREGEDLAVDPDGPRAHKRHHTLTVKSARQFDSDFARYRVSSSDTRTCCNSRCDSHIVDPGAPLAAFSHKYHGFDPYHAASRDSARDVTKLSRAAGSS